MRNKYFRFWLTHNKLRIDDVVAIKDRGLEHEDITSVLVTWSRRIYKLYVDSDSTIQTGYSLVDAKFCDEWDAYYDTSNGEWLENSCQDYPECDICKDRPEKLHLCQMCREPMGLAKGLGHVCMNSNCDVIDGPAVGDLNNLAELKYGRKIEDLSHTIEFNDGMDDE